LIDLGISKLALIGAVALIVIGPEKLPRVAKTLGALLGRAQRYIATVKDEVNRSIDLDELKKMRDQVEGAVRNVESQVHSEVTELENVFSTPAPDILPTTDSTTPHYKHPGKNWRLKTGATPQWYKARNGIRTKALSGAARVARYRPRRITSTAR
jgi:sec-independent protein translocase protein TatB